MMELTFIQKIAIYALPVIFAITVHEAAHGYVARFFGDMTAQEEGRITLNPIKHIDLVGTIVMPALSLYFGSVLFGWAKPVPVNFSRLRQPKKNMLWVAAAGPAANLVMAIGWTVLYKYAPDFGSYAVPVGLMADAGISINVVIMVINLLPIPPLDGGRIVVSLLPQQLAIRFAKIEQYGFIILILLMLLMIQGVLWPILYPVIALVAGFIKWLVL